MSKQISSCAKQIRKLSPISKSSVFSRFCPAYNCIINVRSHHYVLSEIRTDSLWSIWRKRVSVAANWLFSCRLGEVSFTPKFGPDSKCRTLLLRRLCNNWTVNRHKNLIGVPIKYLNIYVLEDWTEDPGLWTNTMDFGWRRHYLWLVLDNPNRDIPKNLWFNQIFKEGVHQLSDGPTNMLGLTVIRCWLLKKGLEWIGFHDGS